MIKILRLLALLLALTLVAAACGDDSDTTTEGDDTSADDTADGDDTSAGDTADDTPADDTAEGDDTEMMVPEELNVAYFSGWPTPNQIGQDDGSFGDAVGVPINWVPFDDGNAMAAGMESGDIDISYSQGLTPFANDANSGADVRIVGIAVAYSEADNCLAQASLGVTRENAADTLAGATIVTPIGNVTHYKMLSMMEFLGVDLETLNIVQGSGAEAAAAFEAGDADVGCAFGAPVVSMTDLGGELIMTGAEQESEIGIAVYDIISIPTSFGETYPDVVTSFLAANEQFNEMWRADPDTNNPIIAQAAGMEDVGNFLSGDLWFSFPTIEEQLSADWLGGQVQTNITEQLATFVRLGEIDSALDDFSAFIDTSYLEAVG